MHESTPDHERRRMSPTVAMAAICVRDTPCRCAAIHLRRPQRPSRARTSATGTSTATRVRPTAWGLRSIVISLWRRPPRPSTHTASYAASVTRTNGDNETCADTRSVAALCPQRTPVAV